MVVDFFGRKWNGLSNNEFCGLFLEMEDNKGGGKLGEVRLNLVKERKLKYVYCIYSRSGFFVERKLSKVVTLFFVIYDR